LQLTQAQAHEAVAGLMKTDRPAALGLAERFAQEHPDSRDAIQLFAWALVYLYEFEKAAAQYKRAARFGTTAGIEEWLGFCQRRLGRYGESAHHYLRALALSDATIDTRAIAANAIHLAGDHAFARQLSYPGRNAPPSAALDFARWMIEFDRQDQRRALRNRLLGNDEFADQAVFFWQQRDVEPLARIDRKDLLARLLEGSTKRRPTWWPETYRLPMQEKAAKAAVRGAPHARWIVKAPQLTGTQGVRALSEAGGEPWPEGTAVLQRFIEPPFLYEGRKINIRLHISLRAPDTSAASLWHDGLVFVSTAPYRDGTHGALFVNPLSAEKSALEQPIGAFAAPGVALQTFLDAAFDTAGARRVRDRLVETASQLVGYLETGGILGAMRAIPGWRGLPPTFFGVDIGLDADLNPWLFEAEVAPGHGLGSPATKEVWRRFRRDWLPLALEAADAPHASFIALA
jgi:tetratricopeptide (TPR) repeat protein